MRLEVRELQDPDGTSRYSVRDGRGQEIVATWSPVRAGRLVRKLAKGRPLCGAGTKEAM